MARPILDRDHGTRHRRRRSSDTRLSNPERGGCKTFTCVRFDGLHLRKSVTVHVYNFFKAITLRPRLLIEEFSAIVLRRLNNCPLGPGAYPESPSSMDSRYSETLKFLVSIHEMPFPFRNLYTPDSYLQSLSDPSITLASSASLKSQGFLCVGLRPTSDPKFGSCTVSTAPKVNCT